MTSPLFHLTDGFPSFLLYRRPIFNLTLRGPPLYLTLETASFLSHLTDGLASFSPYRRPPFNLTLQTAFPQSHLTDGLPSTLRSASVPPQLEAGAVLQARELPLDPGVQGEEGPQGHQGDVPGVQGEEGPAGGGGLGQVQGDHGQGEGGVRGGHQVKHLHDVAWKKY